MLRIVPFITCALAAAAAPANADWRRASSPHFIIYADESPDKLRAFAEELERFDEAVRVARSMKDPPDGKPALARATLVPLAYKPHGGKLAEQAQALIGQIDSGQSTASIDRK